MIAPAVVAAALLLALGMANDHALVWPIYGSSNQCLAASSLLVETRRPASRGLWSTRTPTPAEASVPSEARGVRL